MTLKMLSILRKNLINVLFRYATDFEEVKFSKIPKMTDFVRFQLKILGLN